MAKLRVWLVALLLMATMDAVVAKVDKSEPWQLVSKATLNWLWMDIYQANLYAQSLPLKENFFAEGYPIRLQLCYLKPISKSQLIKAANQGLGYVKSELLKAEVDRLHSVYQDVGKGDCYQLSHEVSGVTRLFLNDKEVFRSQLVGFKSVYFGLWLGERAISIPLKKDLLGEQI